MLHYIIKGIVILSYTRIAVIFLFLILSVLSFIKPAYAVLYAPGETLDPSCAPDAVDCGVASIIGTGLQGQVPYYAANGGVLSATSSITILQNGNVGVGTTSPEYRLDVSSGTAFVTVRFSNRNSLYNIQDMTALGTGGAVQNMIRFNSGATTNWSFGVNQANGNALTFSNASLLSGGPRMVLTTGGSLGLGTTTPSFKLDVVGGGVRALDYVIGSSLATTTNPNIVFVGDSLTAGALGTNPYNFYISLPTYNGQSFTSSNIGVPGFRTYQMLENATSLNAKYSRYSDLNIAVIWGGYNDFHAGQSPAAVYSYLKEFAEHERKLGYKVIIATVISGVGVDSQRNQLNALIRQNWPSFADGIADIAANPNLGTDGAYTNDTYYQPDQVHLTDAGYALVGSLVQPSIMQLVANVNTSKTFVNVSTAGAMNIGTTTIASTSTALFSVIQDSNTPFIVSSSGNIGVGTSTPPSYYKFNVYNSGNTWAGFQSASQYNILDLDSLYSGGGGDNAIRFLDNGTARWSIGQSGENSDSFTFSTSALLSSGPKLTLTTPGALGLGTTTPATNFHISASNVNFVGEYIQNNSATKVSNAPYAYLALLQGGTNGSGVSSWANAGIIESTGVGGLVLDAYGSNGGPINFQINRVNKVTLTAAGNLGIGTTTPSRMLTVAGTVGFVGVATTTGNGSLCLTTAGDVVFNNGSDNCLSSTRETKHSISSLALSELAMLQKLNPVSFVYNGDSEERLRYGFIADEADSVDSHLVTRNADGKLSGLDTSGFLALIVGAIKELSESITTVVLNAKDINGEKLCLGSTCVTESELKNLLNKSNQQPVQQTQPVSPESPVDNPVEPAYPIAPVESPEELPVTPTEPILVEPVESGNTITLVPTEEQSVTSPQEPAEQPVSVGVPL